MKEEVKKEIREMEKDLNLVTRDGYKYTIREMFNRIITLFENTKEVKPDTNIEKELPKITNEIVDCYNCHKQGTIGKYNMCKECEEWFCDNCISLRDSNTCAGCWANNMPKSVCMKHYIGNCKECLKDGETFTFVETPTSRVPSEFSTEELESLESIVYLYYKAPTPEEKEIKKELLDKIKLLLEQKK